MGEQKSVTLEHIFALQESLFVSIIALSGRSPLVAHLRIVYLAKTTVSSGIHLLLNWHRRLKLCLIIYSRCLGLIVCRLTVGIII